MQASLLLITISDHSTLIMHDFLTGQRHIFSLLKHDIILSRKTWIEAEK